MPALIPEMVVNERSYARNGDALVDDVVISGISGKFPESHNIQEFADNLMNNVDMVNDKETRWPKGLYGLPSRSGKLKDLSKFDATFFGVHAKQAAVMDPQLRILLEVVYEAIVDAGINPQEIRGSKTGVYVGVSSGESEEYWTSTEDKVNGYGLVGCCRAMFANRISFSFNFTGPSMALDTACSSSMIGLHEAVKSMRNGDCDAAIVAGVNILLKPASSLQFLRMSMLSNDGKCKVFDSSGNGYVRSETISAIYLQKSRDARRVYATILNVKSNTDGAKDQGITYPSGAMQRQLIENVYTETGVNPADINYIEAHGTGTKVGDPEEVNSIAEVFCKGRNSPLLIGSVKSNMGHSEPASGLCSIAKVLVAMESGVLPGNLHFSSPNTDIPALTDGRLQVVDKNTPWKGGYVAINSFGFGGANVHLLLKSNPKPKQPPVKDGIPKLISVSGRTKEAVKYFIDKVEKMTPDDDFIALIHNISKRNITGHKFRGYSVIGDETKKEISDQISTERQVWYVFSGMGSQWVGMGKPLMVLEPFSKAIKKCAAALSVHGIDLINLINNAKQEDFDSNILLTFVAIAAIQVALVDVLTSLNITPDGIIGHSVGELGCAYADGAFTAEQTVLAAYWRGRCIKEATLIPGTMAAVGLSWEEAKKRLPESIQAACHNGKDSVTISGPSKDVEQFVEQLKSEGVFAKTVQSNGVAFHSKYIAQTGDKLRASLEKIITVAKPRSSRWLSTSIPQSGWSSQLASHSSAAYHVNNLLSPVLFYDTLGHIPEDSVVIEIAPHSLLQAVLKRSLPTTCVNIGLTKRETGVDFLLASIGKLYNVGLNPRLDRLYRPVSFPVSRGTPMIAPLVQWDHSADWDVADFSKANKSGECVIDVDINSEEYKYIAGHCIDGRVLFPATGYMTLVWKTFAKLNQKNMEDLRIIMEDVTFKRATIMPKEGVVKFLVNIFDGSGEFEVVEGGATVVTGRIAMADEDEAPLHLEDGKPDPSYLPLKSQQVYTSLRLRGYDYAGLFNGVRKSDNQGMNGELDWVGNWVSFLDTMLQFSLIGMDTKDLYLPTRIQRMFIDAPKHIELVSKINQQEGVPVHMHGHIEIIQSGGVEIRGMKASLAPKRTQSQAQPKLEKYSFVPYICDKSLDKTSALNVILHTVLENSSNPTIFKVAELAHGLLPDNLLANKIVDILESEPTLETDLTVVSNNIETLTPVVEPLGVKTLKKDISSSPLDTKVHCIATSNLYDNSLKNVYDSLLPGGFFFIESSTNPTKEVTEHNFVLISKITSELKTFFLYRQVVDWKLPSVIKVTNKNYTWLNQLKSFLKQNETKKEKFILVSEGEPDCGIVGLFNCVKQEPGGEHCRCLFLSDKALKFDISSPKIVDQLKKDLLMNIMKDGEWGSMRHIMLNQSQESFFKVEHAYVNTLMRGDLASLRWIEGPLSFFKPEHHPNQHLCTVYYATLNFRDIMLATGKLTPDALPGDAAGQDCILGFEFSGRDTSGNRVMGILSARGLATTIVTDPNFLWPVPDSWTLEQAATVPVVYSTSYYALLVRGRMKPGESVLIHAGSGGVGQAAIRIALSMGCKVFTTVGSQQKRDFLKKTFPQLTDRQIGNSRDCTFEQLVLSETKGRGVDLVLNSLSQDKLLASVRCLANGGRFIEIGKFDLSNNSPLGMSIFLKNTSFHGVLLDALFDFKTVSPEKLEVVQLLSEGIKAGVVQPLPHTTFSSNQMEQSFRFMATGKHIGKVLIKIRDEEREKVIKSSQQLIPAIPRTYMNPDKSYIIVGGLGGFGLELCDWLLTRGAFNVVLVSRSGVTNGYQSMCMRRWKKNGFNVLVSTADSTTEKGAKQLIAQANSMAPVGGIFNLAGVLRDNIIENQTEDQFSVVCNCKVAATRALDTVSRTDCSQLDYFVVFSSVSCGRGNAGQANYGMANSAMERICEERQLQGLPALAIQWGAIGDTGMIINELGGSNESIIGGTLPQRMSSCLSVVDYFLQQPHPVVSSIVVAEKRKKMADSDSMSLSDAIANILGIKDVSSVNESVSLADLGMDSLMGTEIKQTLERSYDLILSPQEIRSLTFGALNKINSKSSADATSEGAKAQDDQEQVQYQAENLIPLETLIKLKDGKSGEDKTIFLVHAIEGDVSSLKEIASQLQATVYGLQATKSVPMDSVKHMASHYVKEIKKVQPKGPYNVCGYSFGACIAFEMSLILEKEGEGVKLVMLDGSPNYVVSAVYKRRDRREDPDNASDQAEALTYFVTLFANIDYAKCFEEIRSLPDLKSRIRMCSYKLKGATKFSEDEIETAAMGFYEKLLAIHRYKPSGVFNSPATLIKASDNYMCDSEDYGLKNICTKPVSVHTLEGSHRSIIKGNSAKKIVDIVTGVFKK